MEIVVIGLNHKTAPIEIRECLAFQEEDLEKALGQAQALPSLRENMILSTCNRVEVYAVAPDPEPAIVALKTFLAQFHQFALKEFEGHLYVHSGEEAVQHVFRVASSLDSMVVGEPQILGQIKDAYETAIQRKTSGLILHRLLHNAFHVAKRVRTETRIGNSAVSVSSVAVELAQKIFETLEERVILLIGAGEMCELAAQHLLSGGVGKVLVTNRTYERAQNLAQKFRGDAIPFEEIHLGLMKADIVICATDARQYILEHGQVARIMKERKQRPIFFIDIADPRNIEPRVNDLENVYLYNIDHLQKVANDHIQDREMEARKAEAIVKEEVDNFVHWYRSLGFTPTIVALRKKFEEIRQKELGKTFSRLPGLSDQERNSLEALTSAIVNKILHSPLSFLKKMGEDHTSSVYLDAIQTLFQLTVLPPETSSGKSEEIPAGEKEDGEKETR
jgi:glutamyl-tRNA reductase